MKLSRRRFGLGGLGVALSAFALGAGSVSKRRFLFVHAEGGWDPLCVFAPMFAAPLIEMEAAAAPLSIGDLQLVDAPNRPAVKQFFQRWGEQTLVLNGISTRSVNHETCQAVALTGSTSDSGTDWATLLAVGQQHEYYLPHVVFRGPSYAGAHTVAVSRAEGMMRETVNGSLLGMVDMPFAAPTDGVRSRLDSYLAKRAATLAANHTNAPLAAAYQSALTRAHTLTDQAQLIDFEPAYSLAGDAANAIRLLADDVIRCASVSTDFVWDTHNDNAEQTDQYQSLFTDLDVIMDALAKTPSKSGAMLSEDTVVVVVSEMGRTPAYNGTGGRDHWPFTSALIIGPGITGGRSVGGYTDLYAGVGVNPATGELDSARPGIDARAFGATLLALGDVDPGEYLLNPEVLTGVLA